MLVYWIYPQTHQQPAEVSAQRIKLKEQFTVYL